MQKDDSPSVNSLAALNQGNARPSPFNVGMSEQDCLTLLALQQLEELGIMSRKQLLRGIARPADLLTSVLSANVVERLKPQSKSCIPEFCART